MNHARHLCALVVTPAYGSRSYEYTAGALTIDSVETQSMRLLWTGVVEERLAEDGLAHPREAIDAAVAAIFEHYPYRAGP